MAVIKVPQPPKSAFNKNRPVSALLKNQILHLHEVERKFPPARHSNIYINSIKTEGEAADYIRKVTAQLHPEGAKRVGFDIAAAGEARAKSKTKTRSKSKPKPKRKKR
jgi:hypothetical protein